MNAWSCQTTTHSPDETAHIAQALAPAMLPGDCILLSGTIGAGKSHFARALIQARLSANGLFEDVPSPTFTIVQTYDDGNREIWHADLYRISSDGEIDELGLIEAFENAITLIEWPERIAGLAPEGALSISFETGSALQERKLTFSWTHDRWSDRIAHATGC